MSKCDCGGEKTRMPCLEWCSTRQVRTGRIPDGVAEKVDAIIEAREPQNGDDENSAELTSARQDMRCNPARVVSEQWYRQRIRLAEAFAAKFKGTPDGNKFEGIARRLRADMKKLYPTIASPGSVKETPDAARRLRADKIEFANGGSVQFFETGGGKWTGMYDSKDEPLQYQEVDLRVGRVVITDRSGIKQWSLNGKLHRVGGPAVEYPNGAKEWHLNGKLHRENGPAVEYPSGTKEWYFNGKLHREDGPAIERESGYNEWLLNGKRHRKDGPAVEFADGDKQWYFNGLRHREDGPAAEWADGTKEWWINGKKVKELAPDEES